MALGSVRAFAEEARLRKFLCSRRSLWEARGGGGSGGGDGCLRSGVVSTPTPTPNDAGTGGTPGEGGGDVSPLHTDAAEDTAFVSNAHGSGLTIVSSTALRNLSERGVDAVLCCAGGSVAVELTEALQHLTSCWCAASNKEEEEEEDPGTLPLPGEGAVDCGNPSPQRRPRDADETPEVICAGCELEHEECASPPERSLKGVGMWGGW